MTENDHLIEAKKCLEFLVKWIKKYKGGDKYITYGNLAKAIDYPEPHKGSHFGKKIGTTLGIMGHLFDSIEVPDWKGSIPYIQSIVVALNTKLPSDGLKEFKIDYPNFSIEKKKDYIKHEYQRIFEFGERWEFILELLHINTIDDNTSIQKSNEKNRYNPYGSEGSPEHRKLRDYISINPKLIGLNEIYDSFVEYPLKSGDSIDVVFKNEDRIIGVEVKSKRSGEDDLERGFYQCIKYREVLKAEDKANNKDREIDCLLVHQDFLTDRLNKIRKILNIDNHLIIIKQNQLNDAYL